MTDSAHMFASSLDVQCSKSCSCSSGGKGVGGGDGEPSSFITAITPFLEVVGGWWERGVGGVCYFVNKFTQMNVP